MSEAIPYEEIKAVNWSSLKHIGVSPKLYRWALNNATDKDAYRLGRAIHMLALEPDKFDWHFGVYDGRRGTHAYDEWLKQNPNKEDLKPREMERVRGAAASLARHEDARKALSGATEQVLQWTDEVTGIPCKARVDAITDTVADLKTTTSAQVRRFRRALTEYEYYVQIAFYYDGAIASKRIAKDAPNPLIVGQEKSPPYDTICVRLSNVALEAGRLRYRDYLKKLANCTAANWWPGAAPDEIELDLAWTPQDEEAELATEGF